MKNGYDPFIAARTRFRSRKSVIGVLTAMSLAVIAGIILLVSSFAASPQLYLSPASGQVLVGNTIAVQIRINSGTDTVNAVQANLSYDPAKLEYQSVDATGSAFSLAASSQVSSGSIQLARATGGGEAPVSGDKLFATIVFKALGGSGTTAVSIAAGSHVVRSTDNTDILVTSAGASYTLTSPATPTPTPTPVATPTPSPVRTPTPTPIPSRTPTPTPTPATTPTPTPVTTSGSLSLSPLSSSVVSGSSITLDIYENSGTTSVNAVQANLVFEAAKLQYVGTSSVGADFPMEAVTTAGSGTLSLTRTRTGGTPPVIGNKLVAKVTFKALATSGVTSVSFGSGSAISSTVGTNVLQQSTGATVNIQAVSSGGGTTTSTPVATATPVTVVPIIGTSKPTPVKGIVQLLAPTTVSSAKVTYALDGHPINSNTIDTTTLDNGVHTVTDTTTDKNGQSRSLTQKIDVNNPVSLWKNVVAHAKSNAILIVILVLLIGAGLVIWLSGHIIFPTRMQVNYSEGVPPNIVTPSSGPGSIVLPDYKTRDESDPPVL